MSGIDPEVMCHQLPINITFKIVAQRKQKMEKEQAIAEEVGKLLKAGFIKEVKYLNWLSNMVMVMKKTGKWHICVNFTNLNKACPKDPYPLPHIDRLIDNSSGFRLLSFMDTYSGYNQILMSPTDAPKTAFMTGRSNYYYEVMPFSLKNSGVTYQHLMDTVFSSQIGRNLKVYVEDMVIKKSEGRDHFIYMKETFRSF